LPVGRGQQGVDPRTPPGRVVAPFCSAIEIKVDSFSEIRDPNDFYLLSHAETIDALYIVSGDADLTTLGKHGKTRIITLAEFKDLYLK